MKNQLEWNNIYDINKPEDLLLSNSAMDQNQLMTQVRLWGIQTELLQDYISLHEFITNHVKVPLLIEFIKHNPSIEQINAFILDNLSDSDLFIIIKNKENSWSKAKLTKAKLENNEFSRMRQAYSQYFNNNDFPILLYIDEWARRQWIHKHFEFDKYLIIDKTISRHRSSLNSPKKIFWNYMLTSRFPALVKEINNWIIWWVEESMIWYHIIQKDPTLDDFWKLSAMYYLDIHERWWTMWYDIADIISEALILSEEKGFWPDKFEELIDWMNTSWVLYWTFYKDTILHLLKLTDARRKEIWKSWLSYIGLWNTDKKASTITSTLLNYFKDNLYTSDPKKLFTKE